VTVLPVLRDVDRLLARIRGIHEAIRDRVVATCENRPAEEVAAIVGDDAGDTLFAIDTGPPPTPRAQVEPALREALRERALGAS
jgi:hypothetical protein